MWTALECRSAPISNTYGRNDTLGDELAISAAQPYTMANAPLLPEPGIVAQFSRRFGVTGPQAPDIG